MKMSKTKEEIAHDLALSCQRCELPTDYEIIGDLWVSRCECGKTSSYDVDYISQEVKNLIPTIGKNKK